MLRGRTPRKPAQVRRAVSTIVESLEERRLLTTLRASADQPATFDYLDEQLNFVHIEVTSSHFVGEFLAARVAGGGQLVIRDLIPYNLIAEPQINEEFGTSDGANLFNIYIAEASADTVITITTFTEDENDPRTYTPFGGNDLDYRYGTEQDQTFSPDGAGNVYIGAQTISVNETAHNIPITRVSNRSAYGVRPANPRGIVAGIDTAPGISLSKIMIAGTVTGHVSVTGSLDTFYAGNVYTGQVFGDGAGIQSSSPNNFYVGGDLHYFLSDGSTGVFRDDEAAPAYNSGFQMKIGGKLGYSFIGGDFGGAVTVVNSPDNPFALNTPFHELELASLDEISSALLYDVESDADASTDAFLGGYLDTATWRNNTEGTMSFGASTTVLDSDGETSLPQSLEFTGILGSYLPAAVDAIDNYGVALMAGQTINVTINDGGLGLNMVGLFDPYGRLVASSFPALGQFELIQNSTTTVDPSVVLPFQTFQYTVKTPGTYRLAVVSTASNTFTGNGEVLADYTVRVESVGNLALGGLVTTGELDLSQQVGIVTGTGDIGAVRTTGKIMNNDGLSSFNARRGNIREILATDDIGLRLTGTTLTVAPVDIYAPRGSVGLLRTLGTSSMYINTLAIDQDYEAVPTSAVGFDYQRVDCGGQFLGNLISNRSIGTVVAGSMTGTYVSGATSFIFQPSAIFANSNNTAEDGRVDLIDVTGDFGSTEVGGPALKTGIGGNIKYIRVGGEVFRDRQAFGTTIPSDVTGIPGQSFIITDDSGSRARISATSFSTVTDGVSTTTQGSLNLTTYGVRESGGVVVVNLNSSTSVQVTSLGGPGSFDISRLTVATGVDGGTTQAGGSAVTYNANTNVMGYAGATAGVITQRPTVAFPITFNGLTPINVMEVMSTVNVTSIDNLTTGELAAVTFTVGATLGKVVAQSVGYIHSNTAADVLVAANIAAGYPSDLFTFGLSTTGANAHILSVYSREDVGSIAAVGTGSSIGYVQANADGTNNRRIYEGIKGIVFATADLAKVHVGEGLASLGTGSTINGVLAGGTEVGQVLAYNADIRGAIVSNGVIRDIRVQNGSLINALVRVVSSADMFNPLVNSLTLPDTQTEPLGIGTPAFTANTTGRTQTAYSLGSLIINGNGGIIGSDIKAGDFKNLAVIGGFGIIGSDIGSTGGFNANGNITVDGLGVRDTDIDIGGSINGINLRGTGSRLNVLGFSQSVRLSEGGGEYDPFSGRPYGMLNDLHKYLGTSTTKPRISGVTNSGMLVNSSILGLDTLGNLTVSNILTNPVNDVPLSSTSYPTRISFANSIQKITVLGSTHGLQVRTGRLDSMGIGNNMEYTDIAVSGPIKLLAIGRNVRGTSKILARGPQGQLQTLIVKRVLNAPVTSTLTIGNLTAGTISSEITSLSSITNLNVTGDVMTGAYIHATKNISNIRIGGDFEAGATFKAKAYGKKTVIGDNLGKFLIG